MAKELPARAPFGRSRSRRRWRRSRGRAGAGAAVRSRGDGGRGDGRDAGDGDRARASVRRARRRLRRGRFQRAGGPLHRDAREVAPARWRRGEARRRGCSVIGGVAVVVAGGARAVLGDPAAGGPDCGARLGSAALDPAPVPAPAAPPLAAPALRRQPRPSRRRRRRPRPRRRSGSRRPNGPNTIRTSAPACRPAAPRRRPRRPASPKSAPAAVPPPARHPSTSRRTIPMAPDGVARRVLWPQAGRRTMFLPELAAF